MTGIPDHMDGSDLADELDRMIRNLELIREAARASNSDGLREARRIVRLNRSLMITVRRRAAA